MKILMQSLIVNLFGGPSAGKSTLAHGLMNHLKINGIECEYASEYAKDLVFDYPGDISVFKNQIEIYQEQRKRIFRYF